MNIKINGMLMEIQESSSNAYDTKVKIIQDDKCIFDNNIYNLLSTIQQGNEINHIDGKILSKIISNYINIMLPVPVINSLVEAMSREHRTLQQTFTALCLQWITHLASLNENQYDARNEYSVKLAKEICNKTYIPKDFPCI